MGGQKVINNDFHPFTKSPKVKSEHSAVSTFIEALIWAHCVEQLFGVCQRSHCCHKPAVQHSALSNICSAYSFGEELWFCFADVLEVKLNLTYFQMGAKFLPTWKVMLCSRVSGSKWIMSKKKGLDSYNPRQK